MNKKLKALLQMSPFTILIFIICANFVEIFLTGLMCLLFLALVFLFIEGLITLITE